MTPQVKQAFLGLAFAFGSIVQSHAYAVDRDTDLGRWFQDNRLFVEAQLRYLDLPIEAAYTREVGLYMEQYLRPGRRETERLLGLAALYMPVFEKHLAVNGLPQSLKFLPVVESALQPTVLSPAKAAGLWQFMPVTARHLGLRIDQWVDDRRDPEAASAAASRLLAHLHERFDNWTLALAAYNCGPVRVQKAIRKAGSTDYSAIKPNLPGQTQRYLAKFKAVAYVLTFADFFGIEPQKTNLYSGSTAQVQVSRHLTFEQVANLAGVPRETVTQLNPRYLQQVIPGESRTPESVILPRRVAKRLSRALGHGNESCEPEPHEEEKPPSPDLFPISEKGLSDHRIGLKKKNRESGKSGRTEIKSAVSPAPPLPQSPPADYPQFMQELGWIPREENHKV